MIGIDEVGRGAWAGPLLVVAARETERLPKGLADSKRLTKLKRERLSPLIRDVCDIGEGWVAAREIDELGLTGAMKLAVLRALMAIGAETHEIIIMDGSVNYVPAKYKEVQTVIDADAIYPIVSAASIVAKVARDDYMASLDAKYEIYKFSKHVGYGTAAHREAIVQYGLSDMHRWSFKPMNGFVS